MKKVLYVEDSLASQVIMRRFLKSVCPVETVTNEADAITLLKEESFGLLIFDYYLGDKDAFGLIERIRKTTDAHTLPIIVLSSSMDLALTTQVIRAGANEAIAKPVNPQLLRETVWKLLEEPYVRVLEECVLRVFCLEWKSSEGYHQFIPDAGIQVCAPTKQAAASAMAEALKAHRSDVERFGNLSQQSITAHLVEFENEQGRVDLLTR